MTCKIFGFQKINLVSFFITSKIEKLTKKIAGWVNSVKSRFSFGPSKINLVKLNPKISSASIK